LWGADPSGKATTYSMELLEMQLTVMSAHPSSLGPGREKYIWNPFPGFCGENATKARCAGVCPETCAFKSLKCPNYCGVNCICKPDYVFDEKLQLCILKSDCPQDIKQEVVETHRVFQ